MLLIHIHFAQKSAKPLTRTPVNLYLRKVSDTTTPHVFIVNMLPCLIRIRA